MIMTRNKIEQLKRLTEALSGIEFKAELGGASFYVLDSEGNPLCKAFCIEKWYEPRTVAEFIAAANPQTILSLIALAERALQPEEGQSCEMTPEQMTAYAQSIADRASQIALPAGSVPEGWKLLPKVPDETMLNAARDWSVKKYGIGVGNDGAIGCYGAMYDAAQQHPEASPAVAQPVAVVRDTLGGVYGEIIREGDIGTVLQEGTLLYAAAPAELAQPVADETIREIFMAHGFTIKEGQTDLKPYVYAAARALLARAALCQPAEEGDKA